MFFIQVNYNSFIERYLTYCKFLGQAWSGEPSFCYRFLADIFNNKYSDCRYFFLKSINSYAHFLTDQCFCSFFLVHFIYACLLAKTYKTDKLLGKYQHLCCGVSSNVWLANRMQTCVGPGYQKFQKDPWIISLTAYHLIPLIIEFLMDIETVEVIEGSNKWVASIKRNFRKKLVMWPSWFRLLL